MVASGLASQRQRPYREVMSSVPWSFTWQIPEPIKTPEDRLAEAAWTRCRSLSDRKSGQTWDDLDWEVRKAWKDGVIADLNAAGVYLTKRKERT